MVLSILADKTTGFVIQTNISAWKETIFYRTFNIYHLNLYKLYIDMCIFRELKDIAKFNTICISFDSIEWENIADLDPEILFQ